MDAHFFFQISLTFSLGIYIQQNYRILCTKILVLNFWENLVLAI